MKNLYFEHEILVRVLCTYMQDCDGQTPRRVGNGHGQYNPKYLLTINKDRTIKTW